MRVSATPLPTPYPPATQALRNATLEKTALWAAEVSVAREAIAAVSVDEADGQTADRSAEKAADKLAKDLLVRFREEMAAKAAGGTGGGGGGNETHRTAAAARAARWLLSRFSRIREPSVPESADPHPSGGLLPAAVSSDPAAVRATTRALHSAALSSAHRFSEEATHEALRHEEELIKARSIPPPNRLNSHTSCRPHLLSSHLLHCFQHAFFHDRVDYV